MTLNDEISMINKCFIPSELTVFKIYTALGIFIFFNFLYIFRIQRMFYCLYILVFPKPPMKNL